MLIMDPKERRKMALDFLVDGGIVVNPENLYKPRDGDIIAVGPAKSGTTWMQQILHQIRTKGDESFRDIYDVTWYMFNPSRQWDFNLNAEQKFNPRVFKHHEAYGVIKNTDKQKIVVIVRDPYDAALSMAKFFSRFFGENEDLTDEETVEVFTRFHSSNIISSFNTISTWWGHRNDPNVLFLFYEDLVHDLEKMIKMISEFVEISLTDKELQRVCYLCSFQYMVQHKEKFQYDLFIEMFSQYKGIEKWTPNVGMVRADGGKVGEGLKKLPPKIRDTVNKLWKDTMQQQYGFESYQDFYNQHGIFAKKP